MGLFSSKYYYYAYAGSSSVYEEIPDQLLSEIIQQSVDTTTKVDMSEAVVNTINLDSYARTKSMMRYAEKGADPLVEGGYVRGFPEASVTFVDIAPEYVEAALTRAVGDWDEIVSLKAGVYDEIFFVEEAMQATYPGGVQWPGTNVDMGTLWHRDLETFKIPVVNPDTGLNYEATNSPDITRFDPAWDFTPDEDDWFLPPILEYLNRYYVSFPYTDNNGDPQTYSTGQFDISDAVTGQWIQVRYKLDDVVYYWSYKVGSGLDPELEDYIDLEERNGAFLPVAVLQHDKVWFNENPESELAITTNKLLKKWATTGDEIRENFEEAEAENPAEAGEYWDFHVHWATPIRCTEQGSKQYLWHFFTELMDWQPNKADRYYDYLATEKGTPTPTGYSQAQPINEINITEAGIKGYNVDYRWSYINKVSFTGKFQVEDTNPLSATFGEMIDLKKGHVNHELMEWARPTSENYVEYIEDMFGPGTDTAYYPTGVPEDERPDTDVWGYHDYVVLWRQRQDSELEEGDDPEVGRYDMMIVMGLSMQYKINTSETGDYRFRYAVPEMFGTEEETKEFRIAMHYGSLQEVDRMKREEAVCEAMTATVFLVQEVKVRWYQTSFFQWIFVIVAIVIIVLTIFYAPQFAGWIKGAITSVAGAFGGSAFAIWVTTAFFTFAIGFIMTQAGIKIAQEFGTTAAIIYAIFAAYAMFVMGGGIENLKSKWAQFQNMKGWMNAAQLLDAVRPIYDIGFQAYSTYAIQKYQQELEDYMKDAKERQEELEEAYAGLTTPKWLDPLDIANVFINNGAYETANTYYSRTLQPNPGLLGYEAVNRFHELALNPPQGQSSGTIVDALMKDLAEQRGEI